MKRMNIFLAQNFFALIITRGWRLGKAVCPIPSCSHHFAGLERWRKGPFVRRRKGLINLSGTYPIKELFCVAGKTKALSL